jgi:hypothetical protein
MNKKLEDMSVEELEAYEMELSKKLKIRTLAEQQAKLKELEEKEARDAEEMKKQKIIEEYKNSVAGDSSEVKLNIDVKTSKKPDNKWVNWLKEYTGGELRTYESIESKGQKSFNFWGSSADDPRNDSCPADVDDWSPEGIWVSAIWHDFYEYSNLLQVVVPGLNIGKGAGFRAYIRSIEPFSTGDITSSLAACDCLSCSSTSINKTYIDIEEHGFATVLCEHDLWDVGDVLRGHWIQEFGLTWSKFFDEEIYDALDGATGNTVANQELVSCTTDCSSPTGDCCEDEFMMELYCAFDKAIGEMRTQYYNPDYIIVHPEVARTFHGMQGPQPVFYNSAIEFGKNGKLASIFGVKVIEYPGANRIDAGDNIAIILDSRRAIGAPFGMRPKMESEYNKECAAYEYYMRCYWGVKVLTQDAIALISCDE